MNTRLIRTQLVIFSIASLIGISVMAFQYLQVPRLLGLGQITVTLQMPSTGGLYRFSNVTYQGVQVGKVMSVAPTEAGAEAILSLDNSRIPAASHAQVRSVSAVGEQYVDLTAASAAPPYLRDGSVIATENTAVPQPVGPMLDKVDSMVASIPGNQLNAALDESFNAFNGAGPGLATLLDSSSRIAQASNGVAAQMSTLIGDAAPLLDSQAQSADVIRAWARSLAGVTDQLVANDAQARTLLQTGPAAAQEVSRLLTQLKPTLPLLLANLATLGQVAVTYNASLEELLVLLPPSVAATSSYAHTNNPTGLGMGAFTIQIGDTPACTTGFLPPSSWRSPADTSDIDTPGDMYCKLPQDSPTVVRGARNYPCMGHPGKRAPTVEICDSDKPYVPQAMREHTLGPDQLDPNLIAQGVPPDARIDPSAGLYGPIAGTPPPPAGALPGAGPAEPGPPPAAVPAPPAQDTDPPVAGAPDASSPPPAEAITPPPDLGDAALPAASPSAFTPGPGAGRSSVAVAQYDPRNGRYVGPDGLMYRQSDLVHTTSPQTWTDLMAH